MRSLITGFFHILLFPIIALGKFLFDWVIMPSFRVFLVLKGYILKALIPAKNSILSLSAHRYVVHALVVIIVMFVSVYNVRSYTAHSETFGEASVFSKLIHGDIANTDETTEEVVDFSVNDKLISLGSNDGALSVLSSLSPIGDEVNAHESGEVISVQTSDISSKPTIIAMPTTIRGKIEIYTVEDGDTLWDISKKFGIDVPTLLATNDLGPRGIIRPRDVIRILPVSGVLHTVKKGENIAVIAKKYAVETSDVLKINQLTESSTINAGDELIVPGGSVQEVAPVVKPKPVVKPTVVATTVKPKAPVEVAVKSDAKPVDKAIAGEWAWPSAGHVITQYFKGKAHTGIDVDGVIGSPNYAAHDGVVEFAGWSVGYGMCIVINHNNGLWTRYGHNSQLFVKIGDTVKAGQNISLMGTTGTSTGSHLHFEVLTGPGKYLNPLKYVK